MTTVRVSSTIGCSQEALFEFHAHASNLPRISGGYPRVQLVSAAEPSNVGDLQELTVDFGVVCFECGAEITKVESPAIIQDRQTHGPFQRWRHQHRFEDAGGGRARLTDTVQFRLFPSPVGDFIEFWTARPALWLIFKLRHRATRRLLEKRPD